MLRPSSVAGGLRSNATLGQQPEAPRRPHIVVLELGREAIRQVEHDLDSSTLHKRNKFVLAILEFCLLGLCGVDRCYAGQICLGLLKGMTVGGLCVWFVVDWLVIVVENFTASADLQALGYRTAFTGGVWAAFWLTLSLTIVVAVSSCYMLFTPAADSPAPQKVMEEFSMFDKEGSGRITKDQLKKVLLGNDVVISDAEVEALFKELDIDRRGTISIVDLQAAFKK